MRNINSNLLRTSLSPNNDDLNDVSVFMRSEAKPTASHNYSNKRFSIGFSSPNNYTDFTLDQANRSIKKINSRYLRNSKQLCTKLNDKLSKSFEINPKKVLKSSSNTMEAPENKKYSDLLHKYHLQLTRNKQKLRNLATMTLNKPLESHKHIWESGKTPKLRSPICISKRTKNHESNYGILPL